MTKLEKLNGLTNRKQEFNMQQQCQLTFNYCLRSVTVIYYSKPCIALFVDMDVLMTAYSILIN